MKKLHVVCPICGKAKFMPIPKSIFNIDEGYLLKLPIQQGIICEHSFVCCIDYNFKIRDYETGIDIQKYLHQKEHTDKNAEFSYF